MSSWFKSIVNKVKNIGEIYIYGEITEDKWVETDVAPQDVRDQIQKLDGMPINLYINSPGGSVFAGYSIYSMLKRHNNTINAYIDGVAASISSVIAMSANKIYIPKNGMLMIHNPSGVAIGTANELRKTADLLDRVRDGIVSIYEDKCKKSRKKIEEYMDSETWFTGEEAVSAGFANELLQNCKLAACVNEKKILSNGYSFDYSNFNAIPIDKIEKVNNINTYENRIKLLKLNQEVA